MIADTEPNTQADNQSSHATRISGMDLPDRKTAAKPTRRNEPSEALLRALRAWHSVKTQQRTAPAA